jgi:hypothetical protein
MVKYFLFIRKYMIIELYDNYKEYDLEIILVNNLEKIQKNTKKILKNYSFEATEGSSLCLID